MNIFFKRAQKKDARTDKSLVQCFLFRTDWLSAVIALAYLCGAFFFYGSRLLAPLHVPIALIFLVLAIRKIYRIYRSKHVYQGMQLIQQRTMRQIIAHKIVLASGLFVFLGVYAFVALVPTDKDVFTGKTESEIRETLAHDTVSAAQLIDMLTVTGEALLNNVALYKKNLTIDEQESLKKEWNEFLGVAVASEAVTDTHRYFPQISFLNARELQAQSFTISYALYMKKFEYFHKIIDAVSTNDEVRTVLNEYVSSFGAKDSYRDVTERYFEASSLLRRNIGYAYYSLFTPDPAEVSSAEYTVLLNVAEESHQYLTSNILSHITDRSIVYSDAFNDGVTGAWLPIQQTVFVDTIGNVHVGDRTEKFITGDHIEAMKEKLNPGDIYVARKNWYASNVGIPGFWTHAGLYTGTLDTMNEYFADLFPYTRNGEVYASFTELVTRLFPETYSTYSVADMYGHLPSVIESETRGTRIQSIEHSASVDYFGVMRPKVAKRDTLESLLRAFTHYNKPYDYKFDLKTKDEIFCSELVYDAYITTKDKAGITLPRSTVSGIELVAPNDIMKKYVTEVDTDDEELTFVYFLDGSEVTGTAFVATKAAFAESFNRPKYSFLQE